MPVDALNDAEALLQAIQERNRNKAKLNRQSFSR
jgi:hypothetical protein